MAGIYRYPATVASEAPRLIIMDAVPYCVPE